MWSAVPRQVVRMRSRTLLAGATATAVFAVMVCGAVLLGNPSRAAAASTLVPTADAYVYSGSSTKNFGSANPEDASASAYRTLLRFDTSSIPAGASVTAADLRLYPMTTMSSGGVQAHPEAAGWSETGVTWANQPAWNTKVLATSGAVTANTTLDIVLPVTAVTTGGETDLALTYSSSGMVAKLASREDPVNPPQLSVVLAGATPSSSSTPTASATATATPSATDSPSPSPSATATASPSPSPVGTPYCGTAAGTPGTTKLMVIFEENQDFSAILPNTGSTPNIEAFANGCGLATNYYSLTHKSLSNYMAATSGVAYNFAPWNADCSPSNCSTANDNIFHEVGPAGWKSYQESMPGNCVINSGSLYVARHNPAAYYTDVDGGTLGGGDCAANDVPLGTTTGGSLITDINAGSLPAFSEVTPNLLDDMHDGGIAQGDAWLGTWIPLIAQGPDYQSGRLAIVIVWDEGSGSGDTPSRVPVVFMSAYITPGTTYTTYATPYTLFQLAQDIAGVSLRRGLGF